MNDFFIHTQNKIDPNQFRAVSLYDLTGLDKNRLRADIISSRSGVISSRSGKNNFTICARIITALVMFVNTKGGL